MNEIARRITGMFAISLAAHYTIDSLAFFSASTAVFKQMFMDRSTHNSRASLVHIKVMCETFLHDLFSEC